MQYETNFKIQVVADCSKGSIIPKGNFQNVDLNLGEAATDFNTFYEHENSAAISMNNPSYCGSLKYTITVTPTLSGLTTF